MLSEGAVVMATAGRDKNKFFCIVEISRDSVKLADGKSRKLEKPKTKNPKHIRATTTLLDLSACNTNKKLRTALRPFSDGVAKSFK